ncbi:hypothetical protein QN277_022598 [Acacia crassicarpa]|uniref:BZIP domain-containing protein n=1 Tax=Acacia crassicarpa TaxID=499986 RepID=A0AAE1MM31_9FABA|nr:hypothetical protein QN277_022598 [Acacia crassicarpa]
MCDEDWINVAMSDDAVVVEILLRLHQPTPPQPPPTKNLPPCLDVDWTGRQRRSRSVPRHRGGSEGKDEPARASPATPLSWSCATSASGGGAGGGGDAVDGCEESSRSMKLVDSSRSKKVTNPNEMTSTKRARRKKTLAELREEENLLLKERKTLKSKLASLRLTVEKHRDANKSLKRMKLDLQSGKTFRTEAASVTTEDEQCHSYNAISSTSITNKVLNNAPLIIPTNSIEAQETSKQEASFLLPDLNLPAEDDLSSNALT